MIGSKFGKPIMFFNRYCTNSIGHEFYKVAYGLLSFYNIKSKHWFHSIELFFKASTKLLLLLATWSSIKVMEQMMVLWILFLFYFTVVWYSFFSFWFLYIYGLTQGDNPTFSDSWSSDPTFSALHFGGITKILKLPTPQSLNYIDLMHSLEGYPRNVPRKSGSGHPSCSSARKSQKEAWWTVPSGGLNKTLLYNLYIKSQLHLSVLAVCGLSKNDFFCSFGEIFGSLLWSLMLWCLIFDLWGPELAVGKLHPLHFGHFFCGVVWISLTFLYTFILVFWIKCSCQFVQTDRHCFRVMSVNVYQDTPVQFFKFKAKCLLILIAFEVNVDPLTLLLFLLYLIAYWKP